MRKATLYDTRNCGHGIVDTPCHECLLEAEREKVRVLREALEKLVEASRDSDSAYYGTLATNFVRGIAHAALQATVQEGP